MKPDVRVLKCLCKLQEPGFEPLLEWLQQERQHCMEVMVATNDESALMMYRYQGRARALGDILTLVDNARETLTKLEK